MRKRIKKFHRKISRLLKWLYKKHKSFITYTWIGIIFTITSIFLLWLFIDILAIPTIISSSIVVGGLFIIKHFIYKWTGYSK